MIAKQYKNFLTDSEARKLTRWSIGRIEGERPISCRKNNSDGKPCSGVRGSQ